MNNLKVGRLSLFTATGGFLAVFATLFVPPVIVLFALIEAIVVAAGVMNFRTRAARIGLIIALIPLPIAATLSAYYGKHPIRTVVQPVEHSVTPALSVYFSPNGGCTSAIVSQIDAAERSIYVQGYGFTSAPIASALRSAHQRGVLVSVILDKSQQTAKYSSATFLHNAGIAPRIDYDHAIAHNKIMIFDSEIVLTGSMNFTKAAEERNAENLLIVRDDALAARYLSNWQEHAAHTRSYEPSSP